MMTIRLVFWDLLTAVGLGRVMNKHSYTWHIAEVVTGCAIKSVGVMTRKDSNVYIAG